MVGAKTEADADIRNPPAGNMENGLFPFTIKVLDWLGFHLKTVMSLVFKFFRSLSLHISINIISQRLDPQKDLR